MSKIIKLLGKEVTKSSGNIPVGNYSSEGPEFQATSGLFRASIDGKNFIVTGKIYWTLEYACQSDQLRTIIDSGSCETLEGAAETVNFAAKNLIKQMIAYLVEN
jgi:hypothetical protein